jgi:chemotaxis protein MotB
MSEDNSNTKQPIIIKRIKKVHNKHHGGSWKIAYADFVTAMMTFFLLMWLLSLLNKYQLQGIATYFKKPLKEVFTKQDNIVDKNLGLDPNQQKLKQETYALPQNQVQVNNTTQQQITTHLKDKDKDKDKDNDQAAMIQKALQNQQQQNEQLKQMKAMQADLQAKLMNDPEISQFRNQLNFIVTADGLKIVIKDLQNKPMFSEGKTDFKIYAVKILSWLSKQINAYKNRIVIIGHTDAVPYVGETNYTNWELSADRANATRRALISAGLDTAKVLRIEGGGDTDLLDTTNGEDPANRRIEIVVLTDQAAKHIQQQ